ncbi:tetratricopeptide repeat protein [Salidesulfovibrio onnuriiensis]|uniref:tetratricopeptide repeat protein n=1 Tax=Salidesulfovibrio onnuriiensis TaxID=2583823 RepID=UPI0011C72AD3|nr:tetratricopeptide repeat protein [Salidesulfovibrio onnuriiensis]
MDKGKTLLEGGQYAEALAVVDQILAIKPGSPAGLMLQGDIHLAQDQRDAALDSYMAAHHSSEMYIEPIKRLVKALRGMNNDLALEYLKKLDFLSPLNPERKADIASVYLEKKDLEHAEEYFDKSIEVMGREARSLVASMADQIAEAVAQVSPVMAEKYLKTVLESKASKLDKGDIHTFNRLGIALRSQGKWRDAVENYEQALRISPEDEVLHYNLALAYQDGREFRSALKSLQKADDLNPQLYKASDTVATNFGNIYLDSGGYDRAEEYFNLALDMNRHNRRAARGVEMTRKMRKRSGKF